MMIKRKKNKGEMNVTKGKWIRLTCLIEANLILSIINRLINDK